MTDLNGISGGCQCGAVRYIATTSPSFSVICHVILVKSGKHVSVYERGRISEHVAAFDVIALRLRGVECPHKLRR